MKFLTTILIFFASFAVALSVTSTVHAGPIGFFVGVDSRPLLPDNPHEAGIYAGLPNPNYNHLTFLVGHLHDHDPATSHFHTISRYNYTGPLSSPTIVDTHPNNRIPEVFTNQPPLPLTSGTGPHAGYLVSDATPGADYSGLPIKSAHSLSVFPPGSVESIILKSQGGGFTSPLTGALVGLELVSTSPGLHVANDLGAPLLVNPNDRYILGGGNTLEFPPTFRIDDSAEAATYSAEFRLLDLSTAAGHTSFLPSGRFQFDLQVVPEPATISLLGVGLISIALLRMRQR